jgi:hypothetical protein
MEEHVHEPQTYGIYVVDRRYKSPEESCHQLAQYMFDFSQLTRRQRIILRNRTERLSELLDWNTLGIYYYRARQMALQRIHPEFEQELLKFTNVTFSAPSTPGVSRSSTPAPPDRDEGSDDEDDADQTSSPHHEEQNSFEKIQTSDEDKVSSATDESFEPRFERADSVRLLSINKQKTRDTAPAAKAALTNGRQLEGTFPDANDDEVGEIIAGIENQGNNFISTSYSKPGLLPDAQTTALNATVNLGLPAPGIFSDPHNGQKESLDNDKKSSISTQKDLPTAELPSADVFHKSLSDDNMASFEPISASGAQYSSAFVDQQAAKSIGKEKI